MLNLDFSKRVVIDANGMDWVKSPAPGVLRKPFAREEAERGHATSIVQFAPGSSFKSHGHPLGEELFILEGVFSDEYGDYGAGSYLRNPPGSIHAPFSGPGCTLFVKLHQFSPGDLTQVKIDTNAGSWSTKENGTQVMVLHEFDRERVALECWPAGTRGEKRGLSGGEEILVLSGMLQDENGGYPAGTWVRNPPGSAQQKLVEEDTVIWIKTGHFPI